MALHYSLAHGCLELLHLHLPCMHQYIVDLHFLNVEVLVYPALTLEAGKRHKWAAIRCGMVESRPRSTLIVGQVEHNCLFLVQGDASGGHFYRFRGRCLDF